MHCDAFLGRSTDVKITEQMHSGPCGAQHSDALTTECIRDAPMAPMAENRRDKTDV
jgi:hypothetical protein